MREAASWCVRQVRTWVALAAALVATMLASDDGKAFWTLTVAVATFALAGLSIRAHWLDEHPDRPDMPDRKQAKHDAMVAEALRRYRGEPEPSPEPEPAPPPPEPEPEPAPPPPPEPEPAPPPPPEPELAPEPVVAKSRRQSYREAREAKRQAKYEAWVEKTLREFRERHADSPPAAVVRRYEDRVETRRTALKPPGRPQ